MSTKQVSTLLAYVIAYLQEEAKQYDNATRYPVPPSMEGVEELLIQKMVRDAIDAYAGGAR